MNNEMVSSQFTIRILQDEDAQSPDDWGNDSLFISTTSNRYFEVKPEQEFPLSEYHQIPLNAYIHSGVALSLGRSYPFDCPWDSGRIGSVWVSKSDWPEESAAIEAAESLVEEWNQYLSGDVWGFVIENEDGEHVESCWGFYGREWCEREAEEMVKFYASEYERSEAIWAH